ncbi:MAG: sialidase family protein [Bryobacteraceae bacterium]
MLLRLLLASGALFAADIGARHVKIYEEQGRFGGWPANHGIWSWGDEILVGFSGAYFQSKGSDRHQMDSTKPEVPYQARSLDGGETWSVERPASLLPPEQGGAAARPLQQAIDFAAPGFAMTIRFADNHVGPSRLWYSTDRGKSWHGGFEFPTFGFPGIAARTDYLVNGKRDALVAVTAAKANRKEGRPILARTTDGGVNWKLVSRVGEEPAGFSIMPSTIRLGARDLLMSVRVKKTETENWIEQYRSLDDGVTWKSEGSIADTGAHAGIRRI